MKETMSNILFFFLYKQNEVETANAKLKQRVSSCLHLILQPEAQTVPSKPTKTTCILFLKLTLKETIDLCSIISFDPDEIFNKKERTCSLSEL